MRIWDLDPKCLCRNHLLGEHRELHAIWSILTGNKKGYARHPETLRWRGKLKALYNRHEALVCEMRRRGYRHASGLDRGKATGSPRQDVLVTPIAEQRALLRKKKCACRTGQKTPARSSA